MKSPKNPDLWWVPLRHHGAGTVAWTPRSYRTFPCQASVPIVVLVVRAAFAVCAFGWSLRYGFSFGALFWTVLPCRVWCGWFSILNFWCKTVTAFGRRDFSWCKGNASVNEQVPLHYSCTKNLTRFPSFSSCLIKRRYFRFFLGCSLLCVHFLSHSFRIVKSPHPEDIT